MARSIIAGLIKNGVETHQISASAPSRQNLDSLEASYGIHTSTQNATFVKHADVIVLAVKPAQMESVCKQISPHRSPDSVLISLAAGVPCSSISQWMGDQTPIVRCMPNTPAQVLAGASGLFANAHTSEAQRTLALDILSAVGIARWVDQEPLIDTVTAVAGSGPAYVFLFLEGMIDTAIEQGLDREAASQLAIQTVLGAAKLAQESDEDVATLRKNVTSPNGTTERAIASFEADNLRKTIKNAMDACTTRARELAQLTQS